MWHDLQTLNATGTVGLGVDPQKMGVQVPLGNDGRALWALHLLAELELLLVPTGVSQVWSLTQFCFVDFSQSRIGVNKCVFNKRTIKVCVSCS